MYWKRSNEIPGLEDAVIFHEGIEPNDIQQGGLGDCYLLAFFGALAEKPERVKKLIDVE